MTVRRFALVLLGLAPACVLAQSDAEDLPPPPEPRLEAYQALQGIDAAAWKALELTAQAGVQSKHARLPKVIKIVTLAVPPSRTLPVRTDTSRLSPLPGGFVLVESDYTVETERLKHLGKRTELRWLGLIPLYNHDVFNINTERAKFGTVEVGGGSITQLDKWSSSDFKLEAMQPGYRWKFEFSTTASDGKCGGRRSADFKLNCAAAEGGSAATLAPELSGNYLRVTCENAARARPAPAEWAYLEDYGYFLALGGGTERVRLQRHIRVLEPVTRP